MGDMGDIFNDLKDERRALRNEFGVDCPNCQIKQPKRTPSILLPGQRCKVDGYRDPRPRLTDEQRVEAVTRPQRGAESNDLDLRERGGAAK